MLPVCVQIVQTCNGISTLPPGTAITTIFLTSAEEVAKYSIEQNWHSSSRTELRR